MLAHVVELAHSAALFPGDWVEIAELAIEHPSVRMALAAEWAGEPDVTGGHIS